MEAVQSPGGVQRNKQQQDNNSSSLANTIKQFDIYTKVEEDYRVRTSNGALCMSSFLSLSLPPLPMYISSLSIVSEHHWMVHHLRSDLL
jgi:hypothetical protein